MATLRRIDSRIRPKRGRAGTAAGNSHHEVPRGLVGYAGYYLKQLFSALLIHNPVSQEEPVDGATPITPKDTPHSRKLKGAVELLEKAADAGNGDAIYLLAQMNFVCN